MRRIALDDLLASPSEIEALARLLSEGGIAAIPTDTFYGLAASPFQEAGVARIFAAKGRDNGKPLPVLAASPERLAELGVSAPAALLLLSHFWPAPLTAVLPLHAPVAASRGGGSLAVRVPADARVRRLLEATGPLTATSANRSGSPPHADPEGVLAQLGGEIDVLVDGGPCPGGKPSTIVDFTVDPPRLLREGAFPWPPRAQPAW